MILFILLNLVIVFSIFNVWIIRYNQETKWRGKDSKSLKEEFQVYGLPIWFMYIIGILKLSLSILLIIGMWFPKIGFYTSLTMIVLMIGALLMHLKVNDPLKKSLPAFTITLLLIGTILQSSNL